MAAIQHAEGGFSFGGVLLTQHTPQPFVGAVLSRGYPGTSSEDLQNSPIICANYSITRSFGASIMITREVRFHGNHGHGAHRHCRATLRLDCRLEGTGKLPTGPHIRLLRPHWLRKREPLETPSEGLRVTLTSTVFARWATEKGADQVRLRESWAVPHGGDPKLARRRDRLVHIRCDVPMDKQTASTW